MLSGPHPGFPAAGRAALAKVGSAHHGAWLPFVGIDHGGRAHVCCHQARRGATGIGGGRPGPLRAQGLTLVGLKLLPPSRSLASSTTGFAGSAPSSADWWTSSPPAPWWPWCGKGSLPAPVLIGATQPLAVAMAGNFSCSPLTDAPPAGQQPFPQRRAWSWGSVAWGRQGRGKCPDPPCSPGAPAQVRRPARGRWLCLAILFQ